MARKPKPKEIIRILTGFLFCGVLWTFFQPVFEVQISGFSAKSWTPCGLARSAANAALRVLPKSKDKLEIKIQVPAGFTDFLKNLFKPQNASGRSFRQWGGLILGSLVLVALALAYLSLLLAAVAFFIYPKGLVKPAGTAVFASAYALLGVFYLGHEAERLFRATVEGASRGLFGFITKAFVPQMALHPGRALYCLPVFALLIWGLAKQNKR